jgi:hypothetical protein
MMSSVAVIWPVKSVILLSSSYLARLQPCLEHLDSIGVVEPARRTVALAVGEGRYGTMSVEVPSSVTVRIAGRSSSVKLILMDAPPTVYSWMAGFLVSPCTVIAVAELGPSGPYSDTPAKPSPLPPADAHRDGRKDAFRAGPSATRPSKRPPELAKMESANVLRCALCPSQNSLWLKRKLSTWVDKGKGKGQDCL